MLNLKLVTFLGIIILVGVFDIGQSVPLTLTLLQQRQASRQSIPLNQGFDLNIQYPFTYFGPLNLTSIDANVFTTYSEIVYLNIYGNTLPTLDATSFTGLVNLKSLILNNNAITTIDPTIFSPFSSTLVTLYLNENLLNTSQLTAISGLTNLRLLDLTDNYIDQIPPGLFANLNKLTNLRLTANQINGQIDSSMFEG